MESACGECGYERPADRAVGVESAGAGLLGEASSSSSCCPVPSERRRVVLRCADGLPSKSVAAELGLHEHTVGKWRRRFLKDRCDGLLDEARPGRPRTINDDQVAAVIERTLRTTPADATHWSIRSTAAETGWFFPHHQSPENWRTPRLHCLRSRYATEPQSCHIRNVGNAFQAELSFLERNLMERARSLPTSTPKASASDAASR